ncbi:MAG TPA: FAD-binding oxidoreductase [Acidimicrobiales bacterium]|nr:FAD-binding oxidoreductase [Acidimicrobiales bacterium]
MTDLAAPDIASFRSSFRGTVLQAGDSGYDDARAIWNGAIDRRPAAFARCSTAADVADALRFARQAGLEVSVRGGGHNFSGAALVDGGLTIDLTAMRSIEVDPDARLVRCGGGTTWGEYDAATQAHGLASPGGFITHTGVAGLTLGGGMGWLSRLYGLACDNLASVELVTVGGDVVRASEDENAELFWAVRGGGGNFGVVTSFEFRLHPVGMLDLHLGFWAPADGVGLMMAVEALRATLPDDVNIFLAGLSAPPEPFVPEHLQGSPGWAVILLGAGSAEAHQAAVEELRRTSPDPLFEFGTPIPYTALQQMFDASAPWGVLGYERALHLETMTEPAAQVLCDQLPRKASPLSFMPIFILGGAYSRVADDATAFGGRRVPCYVVNIAGVAPVPDLYEADRDWVRAVWSDLVPHARGVGSYVNFMSEYEDDRVRSAYGADKYDRLARVKAAWDPDNVLHLNANIKPQS